MLLRLERAAQERSPWGRLEEQVLLVSLASRQAERRRRGASVRSAARLQEEQLLLRGAHERLDGQVHPWEDAR